jgi:hypothetical protein
VALPLRTLLSIVKPGLGFADLNHPIYQGLIAAYLFNEGGGLSNTDAARAQVAALSGTFNWAQTYQGPAINFNGGVSTGPSGQLDPFCFAFWANFTTNAPSHQVIASKSDGGQAFGTLAPGAGWVIENNGSTGIQLNTATSAGVARMFVNANPALNSWHFYVVFWDQTGNMAPPHAGIYVDGQFAATVNSAVGTYPSDSGHALNMGQYNGATNPCSNAQIACFFAWNRFISQVEAQELYLATYPAIPRIYRYVPAGATSKNLTATAATKAGTLGRAISIALTATKATFAGALKLSSTFKLVATAAQKAGVLTTLVPASKTITAQMLQRTGALGREIFHKLSATKATFAGALSAVKTGLFILAATAAQKAGSLTTNSGATFSAVHALFEGRLSLIVNHNTPPSTCTPVATCDMPTAISHVEQCEETGS